MDGAPFVLEALDLHKRFGSMQALGGATLAVRAGEFHGLIGPNGSGKSTLMKCLAGAEAPGSGDIRLRGRSIVRLGPAERARQGLRLKFQITSVMPGLSVYDNLLLALQAMQPFGALLRSASRRALRARVAALLTQFHLAERADDPAGVLSHGQQQWLEIAMAMALTPCVLLLDEPTAGMSVEERRLTGALLAPLHGHCALVIVEHDLDFIRGLCDRITVLDQGRVLDSGSVDHIQNSDKVAQVYVRRS